MSESKRKSVFKTKLNAKWFPVTPLQLAATFVILMFVDGYVYDLPIVNTRGWMPWLPGATVGGPIVTDNPVPTATPGLKSVPVYVTVYIYEGFDANTPGLAGATVDQIFRVYNGQDQLLEQQTTSSGKVTLARLYNSGTDLWVQPRQADVASADPYVGPCVKRTIPNGDGLRASDTVPLEPMYVRDVTATSPTMSTTDQTGKLVSGTTAALGYFNTTDTGCIITIGTIDSDTFYGPEAFTDLKTSYKYDGGVFFMWKGTVAQPFMGYTYTWSDPTNVYYVWKIAPHIVYDSSTGVRSDLVIARVLTDGTTLNADATVVLDAFDIVFLTTTGMTASCLIDGGATGVTAITTKVA